MCTHACAHLCMKTQVSFLSLSLSIRLVDKHLCLLSYLSGLCTLSLGTVFISLAWRSWLG